MNRIYPILFFGFMATLAGCSKEKGPDTGVLKKVFAEEMQRLKPKLVTKRSIIFNQIKPGNQEAGFYAFTISARIHDFMDGKSADDHYGMTSLSTYENVAVELHKAPDGKWIMFGDLPNLSSNRVFDKNPGPGQSAIPLSEVKGELYTTGID